MYTTEGKPVVDLGSGFIGREEGDLGSVKWGSREAADQSRAYRGTF